LDSPKISIIVIDDGSTDGTYDWISNNYPDIHILKGDGNLWWSGSINMGCKYAIDNLNADFVLWWNNDILCSDDYFSQLCHILSSHEENYIIGSKILRLHDKLIWGMGGKFDPNTGKKFMYGERQPDSEYFAKPFNVDWFPGMGTCIHRCVFESIGYLDAESFPQYHGDSDFTFRACKFGFNLMAFPQLIIYNDVSNTGIHHGSSFKYLWASLTNIKSNYNIKKNLVFLKKHATSTRAYLPLLRKYFKYVGGFFKWKLLELIGVKKQYLFKSSKN
jgi:GT2 family glycosyltransferase